MIDGLLFNLCALAAGVYLLHLWRIDLRVRSSSASLDTRALLPGSTPANLSACSIAVIGALLLIAALTWTEHAMGWLATQRTLSPWFLGAMLGAAITEELVFRGYLVVQHRGRTLLVLSAITFSIVFALMHPYLWTHASQPQNVIEWITKLRLSLTPQNLLATTSILILSLWYYTVRFAAFNPTHSLLPCFCAHAAANLTVFLIKLSTGHIN